MTSANECATESVSMRAAPRWVAPVFAVLGAATLPWTAYLALTLPSHANSHHYRLAWVGFDVMLVVILLLTAYFAWRGRPLVGLFAAITATMLVLDAWFDVTTSSPADRPSAILSAVLIELPLAAVCGWIVQHVDQVVERRLRQLARRADRLSATPAGETARKGVRAARTEAAKVAHRGRVAKARAHAAERTVTEAEDGR